VAKPLVRDKERVFQAGYSVRDVAQILGLSPNQVRGYVRAGFLSPRKGKRGEHRFDMQDIVLLRTAKELSARIPPQRLKKALRRLRERLPSGRPLTGVRITAVGENVVVRDGRSLWRVDSGQGLFDFDVSELTARVAPLARRAAEVARGDETKLDAEDWYALAFDLETCDAEQARDAYRRALELDPQHSGARVNLGRLLQEAGHPHAAAAHYRIALLARPDDATAAFNLGVALEDLHQDAEAEAAYEQAVAADPTYADAYYNLSRVYERTGKASAAFRLLKTYRSLIQG
jgi:tetratricopeptide (TPR) repeat protein